MNELLLTAYERFGMITEENYVDMYIDEHLDIDGIIESDINAYNEYLSELEPDDVFYSMDDFNEVMSGSNPWNVAHMCFYGGFNPDNDYFRFNAYETIESMNEWEIANEIKDNRDFLVW